MVRLLGTPADIGCDLGVILAPFIKQRIQEHRVRFPEPLIEKTAAFQTLVEAEAPQWLEEYSAVAEAAGVSFTDLLEVNCAAPLTQIPSCTSALVASDRAARGVPMLLKVRDERPQHQAMGYRRIDGTHGILFSTDPCNLGVGQGCNEKGLAVANNSGGMVLDVADPLGLSDCHVTRLLLERAATVEEALAVFQGLQARNRIGLVDGVRGMIFLLADRTGGCLVIEADQHQCAVQRLDSGFAVFSNHWLLPESAAFTKPVPADQPLQCSSLARYQRGKELLRHKDPVTTGDLEAFSMDQQGMPNSICNPSDDFPWQTVSAFVFELDPGLQHPVRVAQGVPGQVAYRTVRLWQEETPEAYLTEYPS